MYIIIIINNNTKSNNNNKYSTHLFWFFSWFFSLPASQCSAKRWSNTTCSPRVSQQSVTTMHNMYSLCIRIIRVSSTVPLPFPLCLCVTS